MSGAIELPRRYHGNARFEIARQADRCIDWLAINGFEVQSVEASRITIKPSPLCDLLEGVVEGYECVKKRTRRYRMVIRFDCTVVWELPQEKQHNAAVTLWKCLWQRLGEAA